MTIFDSLRYPISIPPTEEQLEALPADLYNDWINNHTVDWYHPSHSHVVKERSNISSWMFLVIDSARKSKAPVDEVKEVEADIAALRKLILEYDNLR